MLCMTTTTVNLATLHRCELIMQGYAAVLLWCGLLVAAVATDVWMQNPGAFWAQPLHGSYDPGPWCEEERR